MGTIKCPYCDFVGFSGEAYDHHWAYDHQFKKRVKVYLNLGSKIGHYEGQLIRQDDDSLIMNVERVYYGDTLAVTWHVPNRQKIGNRHILKVDGL